MSSWSAVDVVRRKRDGEELPDDAVRWVVDGFTAGTVAPEQMSALLMAVFYRGLSPARAGHLDRRHGRLRPAARPVVGRAAPSSTSTPPAASATRCRWSSRRWSPPSGVAVPKLSGRGLGHTGGTLDKLEAIPGLDRRADGVSVPGPAARRRSRHRGRDRRPRARPTRPCTRCAT
jgi:thymidine phosphorylase